MSIDKQIIIDGVDVSVCEAIGTDGWCSFWEENCAKNSDCIHKKYLRKEQECAMLRKMFADIDSASVKLHNNIDQFKAENEELTKEKRNFYNFLTNKYNYGSFRPMWGAYLLKRFFKEDLGDFFDEKAYEMADTIEEKEKQLDKYSQTLTEIKEIANLSIAHWDIDYLKQAINEILQKISEVIK